ncbi:MAG: sulfotransferase [Chloroflexi bacterium]|nr:sulfotransferase [Chloroflexota bacterium]
MHNSNMTNGLPPLILIGAHRSGTSLLARILRECGVFMGADRNQHDESAFFFHCNERIMRVAHAQWDVPSPLSNLWACQPVRGQLTKQLRKEAESKASREYLGDKRFSHSKKLTQLSFPWGWKDPRTTFTLPIWLDIFEGARILHIARNGVDVAQSLHHREKRRKNKLENGRFSCRCMSLEGAFSLWAEYEQACQEFVTNHPQERAHSIRYEDFLLNPGAYLDEIAVWLGIPFASEKVAQAVDGIRPNRAYAFRKSWRLRRFYKQNQQHPLMRKLGYDQL